MVNLYIVDDDPQTCELLQASCSSLLENISTYTSAEEFLQHTPNSQDVILLDLHMPMIDGIEVIRHLAAQHCEAALILISGYDQGVLASAAELARDYGLNLLLTLTKPIDINNLQTTISDYIDPEVCPVKQTKRAANTGFVVSEADLLGAIIERQLVLFYQPKVNIQTGEVVGVEALVRWSHPTQGMIYPNAFIHVAERSGLIEQLTSYVLDMAVEQSVVWQEKGKNIQISVNISGQNITSLSMSEQLSALIETNKLDPSAIVFELTESALMHEAITSLDILIWLGLKGFQLSIDDFGTGYSSISQLHRVPFAELKVDKSFVEHINRDEQSLLIVQTCIMLGHQLNMKVVAVGIENEAAMKTLKELNCDIAQGYFIAKPMSVADFDLWFESYSMLDLSNV